MRTRRLYPLIAALMMLPGCWTGAEPSNQSPGGRESLERSDGAGKPRGAAFQSACELEPKLLARIRRGDYPGRSPDVIVVPRRPNYFGGFTISTHAGPWDYLQKVPLVLYGKRFVKSQGEIRLERAPTVADIAPTIAELLRTPWPDDLPGTPLTEALVDRARRPITPKVIVTVVWDGGGWNVLNASPRAWPTLARMMRTGTSIADLTVGSSPSVTPAIHATMGTGAFPRRHGIVDVWLRDGSKVVSSWEDQSPRYLELPTIADLYDRRTDNQAQVALVAERSWHLGMMGHGAYIPGGDKDIAVMTGTPGELSTNPRWYSLPPYLEGLGGLEDDIRAVDIEDGKLDSKWLDEHSLENGDGLALTPVPTLHQSRILSTLIGTEGLGDDAVADLLFTNFKELDNIGHVWRPHEQEIASILRHTDDALRRLVGSLDNEVGKGEWVLIVTADHGQAPDASLVGAWPIAMTSLLDATASELGVRPGDLFEKQRPGALWLDRRTLAEEGITAADVAEAVLEHRLIDNVGSDGELPGEYESRAQERLFSTAFPSRWMSQVWRCATRRKG